MAITNAQIITQYKQDHGFPLDYPLFTYAAWIAQGYRVRKGEKCKHRVTMWRMGQKKDDEGNMVNTGKCFHKTMSLFEMSQVERMV